LCKAVVVVLEAFDKPAQQHLTIPAMISTAQINDQYLSLSAEQDATANHSAPSQAPVATYELPQNKLFESASALHYNDRIKTTFLVTQEFQPDFSLIRGLIEFNRPRDLMFSFDRTSKTVNINLAKDQLSRLDGLLSRVYDELMKEKLFRKTLRTVIEFEQRYTRERDRLYAKLKNSVAAPNAV
jgi:hypothetical protein